MSSDTKTVQQKKEHKDIRLLVIIIISGCGILGSVIALNIFQSESIPLTWKIAITTFIILLPISLFLQPLMASSRLRTERLVNYKQQFADIYEEVSNTYLYISKGEVDADADYDFNMNYSRGLEKISNFNTNLSRIYRDCFNKLMEEEEEGELRRSLPVSFWLYKRIRKENIEKKSQDPETKRKKEIRRRNFLDFNFSGLLEKVVIDELRSENRDLHSYFLPITFFMIIYFGGFLVTIPLINSVFEGGETTAVIPLINQNNIPIQAIQWGFLGGVVYTSINLIHRFLRSDLIPQVYLYSSYRLIFSVVAAIIVYFVYFIATPTSLLLDDIYKTSTTILLTCFAIGITPINFLLRFAQTIALKLMQWRSNSNAGNQNVTVLEGINLVISERLGEEGIENVQQLACCNPKELFEQTHFDKITVCDWKDQALLYLYTHNITVCKKIFVSEKDSKSSQLPLNEILYSILGIRTYSQLINIYTNNKNDFVKDLSSKLSISEMQFCIIMDAITSYTDLYYEKMIEIRHMDDKKRILKYKLDNMIKKVSS